MTLKDITEGDLARNIPLCSKESPNHRSQVKVGDAVFGGDKFVVIAGPCAVENRNQVLDIAKAVKGSGATVMRGGAFKPMTFPYRNEKTFQLEEEGLRYLEEVRQTTGLPIVTEVLDPRDVEMVAKYADMLQIGARNMQNFPLLSEVGQSSKPVLLKRHFGCSLRDWLGAAEYILHQGNPNVVLCERGVTAPHTHEPTSRFIVDIQVIPAVREYTHLPVIVDPSHATFKRSYVPPIAKAAIAVGADGIILDVHPVPEEAAIDPLQALSYPVFDQLMTDLRAIGQAVGRPI
jgi:3-deoxy-7-phosphoheptulonate synthase